MINTTESESEYKDLDQKSIQELLVGINQQDALVALAVQKSIPQIEKVVTSVVEALKNGGRLFYIGAGTSGRLGIVDASECPPTFGVSHNLVIGIIAGGDGAIRKAVEFAEDDESQAIIDLKNYNFSEKDFLIGIAASGRTPYVIGGVNDARKLGAQTACIVCNLGSELAQAVDLPIEVVVGPEFLTGSTRMKAGTAQKLVLNMITTTTMITLGKVKGNKMVHMQLSNLKLIARGEKMLQDELHISAQEAQKLLKAHGNVNKAIIAFKK